MFSAECPGSIVCDDPPHCEPVDVVCDGIAQCSDGTDEAVCPGRSVEITFSVVIFHMVNILMNFVKFKYGNESSNLKRKRLKV